jgi:hypothetical protein
MRRAEIFKRTESSTKFGSPCDLPGAGGNPNLRLIHQAKKFKHI